MMKRFYAMGWGWNFRLPFGWWLVYVSPSHCEHEYPRLYISNDGTPPYAGNKGRVLWA